MCLLKNWLNCSELTLALWYCLPSKSTCLDKFVLSKCRTSGLLCCLHLLEAFVQLTWWGCTLHVPPTGTTVQTSFEPPTLTLWSNKNDTTEQAWGAEMAVNLLKDFLAQSTHPRPITPLAANKTESVHVKADVVGVQHWAMTQPAGGGVINPKQKRHTRSDQSPV